MQTAILTHQAMANFQRSTPVSNAYYLSTQISGQEQFLEKANYWDYQVSDSKEYACKDSSKDNRNSGYKVKRRQGQLFVMEANPVGEKHLLSGRNEQFLAEWLQYSSVGLVRINADIGELRLKTWANLCKRFDKEIFLRIPRHQELPEYGNPISWWFKRSLDLIAAVILLIVFSPVLLALAILIRVNSRGSILTCQWCVGKGGKFFQMYQFRTIFSDVDFDAENQPKQMYLERWLQKSRLEKLPQLLNVLKGEMSLVGRSPRTLDEAIKINYEEMKLLNILPGIAGVWQIKDKLKLSSFDNINEWEIDYLYHWSLWQDFEILFLAIPKFISGLGFE
jgi:lipopolysaccharide/colanic/teichoic acid biosynthesis glycosyltransferase